MEIKLNHSAVTFDAKEHRYFLPDGKEIGGVTPIVGWVFPQTYAFVSQETLDNAAEHGTNVHQGIEIIDVVGACDEFPFNEPFLQMMEENHMKVISHEYLISDSRIASSIDLVLQDENGDIWLADIKTTSALHESNVRLQLSVYRYLFELQNPDIKVKGVAAVWLPKTRKPAYREISLTEIDQTKETIEAYLAGGNGEDYAKYFTEEIPDLPAQYVDVVKAIIDLEQAAKDANNQSKKFKAELLKLFRANGWKKFESEHLLITYVAPSTRTSVDSDKLKTEYKDAYKACLKSSETSDSIRVKLR